MTELIERDWTLLIDVDGVLLLEAKPIEGATQAIDFLNKNAISYLIVTNYTRLSKNQLAKRFKDAGLNIPLEKIFTPIIAAIGYMKSIKEKPKCYLIGSEGVAEEFRESGIEVTREEEPVDFVVVGLYHKTNYTMLNKAFQLIKSGAGFIGLNPYRQYPSADRIVLGPGCFIKGLEYCTKKEAMILGKPNKNFFELAVKMIGSKKDRTLMVGDDLESDLISAQCAGLKALSVKTGNFNKKELEASKQKPDYLIDSIKDLPNIFSQK